MNTDIKHRSKKDFFVLLNEEYGYRRWFWFPDMSPEKLELWWLALESVDPYFMTPEPLPGTLYQVQTDDEFDLFNTLLDTNTVYYAHTHCDDDSFLMRPNKEKIHHKGLEARDE